LEEVIGQSVAVVAESPNKRRWVCDRAVLMAAETYRHQIATFNPTDIFSTDLGHLFVT